MKTIHYFFMVLLAIGTTTQAFAQLGLIPSNNPNILANTIVGAGITVSNATLTCPTGASGTFSNGVPTNVGIDRGVVLATGLITNAQAPNTSQNTTTAFGAPGDADLTFLNGFPTNDACGLEFDFTAVANRITISYVFGSEEYLEFVDTEFNDVFGFLVTGPNPLGGNYTNLNIATIPVNVPVTINSINDVLNSSFYVDNPPPTNLTRIEYDGYTVVLTASLDIIPCETYHFKLAIADGSDLNLDSGVFLEEASFEASLQCQDVTLVLGEDGTGSVTPEELIASDLDACNFSFTVSQADFVCSDEGENVVTVTADDGMGTVLTCEAIVLVVVPEDILTIDFGPECRTVYPGYGPSACTTLTANVSGGNGPYTYLWSTGETTQSINVCPAVSTDYTVTATDANGCVEVSGTIHVEAVDVHCGNNGDKVLICHIPPGNPDNAYSICISPSAVPAHLAHGCFLGDCAETADPCAGESPFIIHHDVIDPDENGAEVLIWPNPGSNEINIELPFITEGKVTIELMTPEGVQLSLLSLKEGIRKTTLPDLYLRPDGLYYVLIRDQSGQQWVHKWLKSN